MEVDENIDFCNGDTGVKDWPKATSRSCVKSRREIKDLMETN